MNNPFDFFDAIFCINLDSRPDRWLECADIFKEYGIGDRAQRYSASRIEAPNVNPKYLGRAGCAHSHFSIAKKALQEGYDNYLVLEDDFQFRFDRDDFEKKLELSLSQLPADWDLLYLGCNLDQSYGAYPIEHFSDSLLKLNSAHTTHAMSFNKNFIKRFAEEAPDDHSIVDWVMQNQAIDVYFSAAVLQQINAFTVDPLLVLQRPSFSDIECQAYDYSQWMLQTFDIFKKNLKPNENE